MKKKPGRPKLKASERKEILPIRFSQIELKELKRASKGQPLTTWMRETLLAAAQGRNAAMAGIKAMVDEATILSSEGIRNPESKRSVPANSRVLTLR